MVQLLVKAGQGQRDDSWDVEYHQLQQDIVIFNTCLVKDCTAVDMLNENQRDLRDVIK
jgi:hypothetical protein